MIYIIIAVAVVAIIVLAVILGVVLSKGDFGDLFESGKKRAGRQGEQFAAQLIRGILNEKDVLLNNVCISFGDKPAELDNVIINNRGVFVIEVKNYSGTLYGNEDDYEWMKTKRTDAGNIYQKSVKNPIPQVKRQVYILSSFLKQYGINVWVEGYAFLVGRNSPVRSKYVLDSINGINDAIHLGTNNNLTKSQKDRIVELLS